MHLLRSLGLWLALLVVAFVPLGIAAQSPLLEWRDAPYVAAGLAGIAALGLMVFQPLLAAGLIPGIALAPGRQLHRWIGGALVALVALHVGGLWITSPPDVIDALLFASPTPFSAWGVIAMWALIGTTLVAVSRPRFRQSLRLWRILHSLLGCVIVIGSVVHTVRIIGTMETVSKVVLCGAVVLALAKALYDLRLWKPRGAAR